VADDMGFVLIDRPAFVMQFLAMYPTKSEQQAQQLWDVLFGNAPNKFPAGSNEAVRYLTQDSCQKILEHYRLFDSGIDFQNLPIGFFLAKNPLGGVQDVLHFSNYIANHNTLKKPLAITLSSIKQQVLESHEFKPPQSEWYEFLRTKMINGDAIYCTEKELKDAFITFSNTLSRLGLDFYQLNCNEFDKNFNPIVLLGRWNTTLTQANLKQKNLKAQWEVLPQLYFTQGYGAIRALTDYQNTEAPCGFILPKMYGNELNIEFSYIKTVDQAKSIHSEMEFWRYLAYQPQCNSINFYRKAIDVINSMDILDDKKQEMLQILAASTSANGHSAKNMVDEEKELHIWMSFCNLIDTITRASLTLITINAHISKTSGDPYRIKNETIRRLNRPDVLPNILFLNSVAECIKEHLNAFNLAEVVVQLASGRDPYQPLVDLSDKLNAMINQYHADFYEGSRFYFVADKWEALGFQKYTELQYDLFHYSSRYAAPIIAPYLSTFNIQKIEDTSDIERQLTAVNEGDKRNIAYCLKFFKDTVKQQDPSILLDLIMGIRSGLGGDSLLSHLDYIASKFANSFPSGYFEQKRKELIDAQFGLNEEQMQHVRALHLAEEQTQAIISIESELLIKNNLITTQELDALNTLFLRLSHLIAPSDFTEFTRRLASVRINLPGSSEKLNKLLELLIKQKSLGSFNQIFFRNKIEKCLDTSLIDKFNLYIETIKPLAKTQGTINSQNIQDLLAMIVLNCDFNTFAQEKFLEKIKGLLSSLKKISEAHPHIQEHLLHAFTCISGKNTAHYFFNINQFVQCINDIADILQTGDDAVAQKDMLTFFATLANFNKEPDNLTKIWQILSTLESTEQKKFLLILVNSFKEKNQSLDGLSNLVDRIKQDTQVYQTLKEQCVHPPYPKLSSINEWLDGKFKENYQKFSMRPYGKRHLEFSFKLKEFDVQKAKFIGVEAELFTDELAECLNEQLKKNRKCSVQELSHSFNLLKEGQKPLSNQQKIQLLCLCIEMLARTTAQLDRSIPPKLISQELNTTQVMALHAMLMNPQNKLISELDTGEGKSRIMMVLAACQAAQGKTVDFLTSDMPLAERDYLAYNAFFTSLDIRSSLISLNTPKQLYQKGGVNISDYSQLLLLRNKSDIQLAPYAYLDEHEEQRCLLIDEVDKFKHDKSQDAYNYASQSSKLKGYLWVYPLLVNYIQQWLKKNPSGTEFNAKLLTDDFVKFVAAHDLDVEHQAKIAAINEKKEHKAQLITWLKAAHTAVHMQIDDRYKVTERLDSKLFSVRDVDGYTRYTRKVLVLDTGRPIEGSSFSDGVHQCLCAIENQKAEKEEFVIPPENVTQRTIYPISFMAKYEKGNIFGVSGTSRREGPSSSKDINYENYNYIRVPRQKELKREDKNVWVAKNQTQQIAFIKQCIIEKLKADPKWPILLFCKNDQQSQNIFAALTEDQEVAELLEKATRVHALTEKNDEVAAIAEAGKPGVLTVATAGMFARGVDIHAESSPLLVLGSYVPTIEDEVQMKGRTGRFGNLGEYRMILDLSDPDCPIKGSTYNINNEINKLQNRMALSSTYYEEISKLYAEFLENITQKFLSNLANLDKAYHLRYLDAWQNYLGDLQKDWDDHRQPMLIAIENNNKDEFITQFNKFTHKWESGAATFIKGFDKPLAEKPSMAEKAGIIYNSLAQQQTFFKPKRQKIEVQHKYDFSDDGQARIYDTLFAQELAVLRGERSFFADYYAWKEGRGALFPDLMATLRGDRPLFANLMATIARLVREIKVCFDNQEISSHEQGDLEYSEKDDSFEEQPNINDNDDVIVDYGAGLGF
jgi:preprotein translocase subunit SecA